MSEDVKPWTNPSADDVIRKWEEVYKKEKAEDRARADRKMKIVLTEIKKDAVVKIMLEYDGHGDEGFITKITLVKSDGSRVEIDLRSPEGERLYDPLNEFIFSLLPGAWENGEGGFGTCVINVETGEYDLNHLWGSGKLGTLGAA